MSSTVNVSKEYLALIMRFPLRPIRDEETLDAASEIFSELVIKAESRAPGESDYVAVLGNLIREYEEAHIAQSIGAGTAVESSTICIF